MANIWEYYQKQAHYFEWACSLRYTNINNKILKKLNIAVTKKLMCNNSEINVLK